MRIFADVELSEDMINSIDILSKKSGVSRSVFIHRVLEEAVRKSELRPSCTQIDFAKCALAYGNFFRNMRVQVGKIPYRKQDALSAKHQRMIEEYIRLCDKVALAFAKL